MDVHLANLHGGRRLVVDPIHALAQVTQEERHITVAQATSAHVRHVVGQGEAVDVELRVQLVCLASGEQVKQQVGHSLWVLVLVRQCL